MNIGIIGLGLIGGTIAKNLRENHYISAYDISKESLEYGLEKNIIHQAYYDLKDFFNNNDVIYLCLYPERIINFIFENKDIIPKNSVIIEISGVKKHLISEISKLGDLDFDIVYSHPIAGSEKIGVAHAKSKIFHKANYVITPIDSNKIKNIEITKKLAKEMGFRNISIVSPEEHDEIIAYTSQLTHVLSLSLVNSISTNLDTKKFIGDSYKDLTRISKINEELWPDLFISNKDALLEKITAFEHELMLFKDALKMNDVEKLKQIMINSTSIRNSMDKGENHES